jgi:hypothetical protein
MWCHPETGVFFPAEKSASVSVKAVPGQVAGGLVLLGKRAAFTALAVTAQDNGGAYALDDPLVFAVLADGVKIDRLTLVIFHAHGSKPPILNSRYP